MAKELTKAQVEKLLTTDARFKVFKEKLKKLGYVKKDMAEVPTVLSMLSDLEGDRVSKYAEFGE